MATDSINSVVAPFVERIGGLIHALHAMMSKFGYIDPIHFGEIAEIFNISEAEVRGVVSFYHDFRTSPPAPTRIRICQAEACQALGARSLTKKIESRLNTSLDDESEEARVSIEPVYCLGLCAIGPAIQINNKLIARATAEHVPTS